MPGSDAEKWMQFAQDDLAPGKSLTRMNDSAKFIVSTVSLVGAVLTGFGLVASARIGDSNTAVFAAVVSLGTTLIALLLALIFLRQRVGSLNVHNLKEVRSWYDAQVNRGWMVIVASLFLILAVSAAGVAAIATIVHSPDHRPRIVLQGEPTGRGWIVSGSVQCDGCLPDRTYRIVLTGGSGATRTTCSRGVAVTDDKGVFMVSIPGCRLPGRATATLAIDGKTVTTLAGGQR